MLCFEPDPTPQASRRKLMEIDTTLPSRWNVIRRNKREYNDPWSFRRFGTINCGQNVRGAKNNQNYIAHTPNNYASSNTFNIERKPLRTKEHSTDDEYDMSDAETLGSNDSIRSEQESEYSTDREFMTNDDDNDISITSIDDNDISKKCLDITSDDDYTHNNDNDTHWTTNIDNNDNYNNNNNNNIFDRKHTQYVTENYNYTDWIADNDDDDDSDCDIFENDEDYEVITEKDIENDEKAAKENEEYNSRTDLDEDARNWKYKGHPQLRQIRRFQKGNGLLVSKQEFVSFIGNIIYNVQQDINIPIEMELESIKPLQEEAEAYMIKLFEDANLFAIHSGRMSVNETDIKAVLKIIKNKRKDYKRLLMIIAKYSDDQENVSN